MNPIAKLQKWMDTPAGQVFMNYAYSWGAAVVILGTLFKLTHIPGANLMLFIGMGTEVFVFFIAAFEKPYTKEISTAATNPIAQVAATPITQVAAAADAIAIAPSEAPSSPISPIAHEGSPSTPISPDLAAATNPAAVEEAIVKYTQQLEELTETLSRVQAQADHLTTDSSEMENLNRTLTGIATVYELQLRNISKQLGTIEQIDEQTRVMAQRIEELNNVYARMVSALRVNMGGASNTL